MLLCLMCRGLAYRRPVEGQCPECRQPWVPTKTLIPRAPVPPPAPEAPAAPSAPPVSPDARQPAQELGRLGEAKGGVAKAKRAAPRPRPLPPRARDIDFRARHFGPPKPPTLDRQLLGYVRWSEHIANQRHSVGNILREMERGQMLETSIDRDTCEVMLLLLFLTPDTKLLARATAIDAAFVYDVGVRMVKNKIADLKKGEFRIEWFEKETGTMALLLDLMCVRGRLTRSLDPDNKIGYKKTDG